MSFMSRERLKERGEELRGRKHASPVLLNPVFCSPLLLRFSFP